MEEYTYVRMWPYRSARITDITAREEHRNEKLYNMIPKDKRDNHIVAMYACNEHMVYVMFTDNVTIYGKGVIVKEW